jgi:hypothetical protein
MSEQTAETMGKTRGRDRIAELLPVIDFLDATVRYRVQAIESGRKPSEHFPDLNAARCQRRVYAARGLSLASVAKVKLELPPEPAIPDLARLLALVERSHDIRRQIDHEIGKTEAELKKARDGLQGDIDTLKDATLYAAAGYAETPHFRAERALLLEGQARRRLLAKWVGGNWTHLQHQIPQLHELDLEFKLLMQAVNHNLDRTNSTRVWAQNAMVLRLNTRYATLRDLSVQLAEQEGDQKRAEEVVAAKVQTAIDQAGGREVVAKAVRDALITTNAWLEASPDWPTISTADQRIRAIRDQADKLEAGSTLRANLEQDIAVLVEKVTPLRAAIESKRLEDVETLLSAALLGNEAARAQLEAIATQTPRAFADGFATAIAAAKFERSVLAELARVLK